MSKKEEFDATENKIYNVLISNGQGKVDLPNDVFSVTATATGYDGSTLNPASVTVTAGVTEYSFTISATGSLILHVTEDGTSAGTPVEGATFYRCDNNGNTYGSAFTTDSTGNATLTNIPWDTDGNAKIYYKQTETASGHSFDSKLKEIVLTQATTTVEVENQLLVSRTIKLTEAGYDGLSVPGASMVLANDD